MGAAGGANVVVGAVETRRRARDEAGVEVVGGEGGSEGAHGAEDGPGGRRVAPGILARTSPPARTRMKYG
jgi:hypothetical protein